MNVLLLDGRLATDEYQELADDAPLPASADAIVVSLERWHRDTHALAATGSKVAVRLANTIDVTTLPDSLLACPMIELWFPAFADGRAYSQARLLRSRLGYRGQIRARGSAVVADQLQSMARVGIDAFVLREDQDSETAARALHGFDLAYQGACDALPRVRQLRRSAFASR
ncbi:DUF934 domain-containing protein [Solimonas variicoloris]|uniref:DUF934 domain-containing protein n=1 Tax=Solimonas variicoloris TaxID=254408 RepID=UPI00037D60C6|nr:DUF934 domain-containing protein [Solimonas variicoloris]